MISITGSHGQLMSLDSAVGKGVDLPQWCWHKDTSAMGCSATCSHAAQKAPHQDHSDTWRWRHGQMGSLCTDWRRAGSLIQLGLDMKCPSPNLLAKWNCRNDILANFKQSADYTIDKLPPEADQQLESLWKQELRSGSAQGSAAPPWNSALKSRNGSRNTNVIAGQILERTRAHERTPVAMGETTADQPVLKHWRRKQVPKEAQTDCLPLKNPKETCSHSTLIQMVNPLYLCLPEILCSSLVGSWSHLEVTWTSSTTKLPSCSQSTSVPWKLTSWAGQKLSPMQLVMQSIW